MQSDPDINVMELIDSQRLSWTRITIVVLCGLIAELDGLDLQAIGLAAPAMAAALHIAPQALGSVFSAALAGLAVGAFGLGLAADRIGRKRVLIASTLCFGVFTLCTAFASSMNELSSFGSAPDWGLAARCQASSVSAPNTSPVAFERPSSPRFGPGSRWAG